MSEDTELLKGCLEGIKEAREAVEKAAEMVGEMCGELDRLKAQGAIPIKIYYLSQCVEVNWEYLSNSVKETIDYIKQERNNR